MTTVLSSRDSTREFAFEKADFHKVQNMLFKKAGIKLSDAKEAMVYSRLARRIRALQLTSFNGRSFASDAVRITILFR